MATPEQGRAPRARVNPNSAPADGNARRWTGGPTEIPRETPHRRGSRESGGGRLNLKPPDVIVPASAAAASASSSSSSSSRRRCRASSSSTSRPPV